MKYVLLFIFVLIGYTSFSQGIYLSRAAISRLSKKVENCNLLEKKLAVVNNQVTQLRAILIQREIEFETTLATLDSVIAVAEDDLSELQKKYDKAVLLIPKRKRKKL